jgi:hypothetical protein
LLSAVTLASVVCPGETQLILVDLMMEPSDGPIQTTPGAHMPGVVKGDRLQDPSKPSCDSYINTPTKHQQGQSVKAITETEILLNKLEIRTMHCRFDPTTAGTVTYRLLKGPPKPN